MKSCDRCKIETTLTKMSWFNLDMICMKCCEKEKDHPKYEEAKRVELEECIKGNMNFKGIGYTELEVKNATRS